MPKIKSHKSTTKRIKKTGGNKLVHERSSTHHKLQHQSGSRRRRLNIAKPLHESNQNRVSRVV